MAFDNLFLFSADTYMTTARKSADSAFAFNTLKVQFCYVMIDDNDRKGNRAWQTPRTPLYLQWWFTVTGFNRALVAIEPATAVDALPCSAL